MKCLNVKNNLNKFTKNKYLLDWVNEVASLTNPSEIILIDGSKSQIRQLQKEACETGEIIELNQKKLPGCYYHRTNPNDVARVEDRTFICCREEENAGPTNNWKSPEEAYKMGEEILRNSMEGRPMYVIPYCMGPLGSSFSKIGVELTDSIYVVLNMHIMTRTGKQALNMLSLTNDFVRGLHGKCNLDDSNRYILQFPEDNTIWSINSNYGGNVLLGKKCFALRIGTYMGKNEGWMAEHMLILGIENPQGEVKYVAAAFPSACGKTNLAMLIPPEIFTQKGYKVWTVGDDIAWIRIGADGRMYAVNPEYGFFGVAPGTNKKSNPNALATTKIGTIFTNVAINKDDMTVWWEGLTKTPPSNNMEDWLGNPWDWKNSTEKGAYPNSRFTAPAKYCPCISKAWEDPSGVPLSAIIFGGRRAKTAPLVYQARDWNHGVFIGSAMASETTAAANGKVGVVRRDPMAMLPFCGYNMADYFGHWIKMGTKTDKLPKIFHVNWFRTDDNGKYIWPGFGNNFRVLEWMLKRCENKVDAKEVEIGYVPNAKDINIEGLDLSEDVIEELLSIDKDLWLEDANGIEEFYNKFEGKIPKELMNELNTLKNNLK